MTDSQLRDWCNGVLAGDDGFRFATGRDADVRLARAVATRLLELLPAADDATLVTVEWLKDVGFVCEDGVFIREQDIGYDCHVVGLMTENATEWELYDSFGSGENKVSAFALPTRGHVRRLCQAIGINLTESK